MLAALRDFFDRHIGSPEAQRDPAHAIQLATAALLMEVARTDGGVSPTERESVERAVRGKFGLDAGEAAALVSLAEQEVTQANDYYQFTSLINRAFSPEQKVRVVETMWAAAYADGELSAHENHVMRKVADLLYVPHAEYIAAKMRAKAAAEGPCAAAPDA
jgi:uncharacterized tellurite resistance protein B-like protein